LLRWPLRINVFNQLTAYPIWICAGFVAVINRNQRMPLKFTPWFVYKYPRSEVRIELSYLQASSHQPTPLSQRKTRTQLCKSPPEIKNAQNWSWWPDKQFKISSYHGIWEIIPCSWGAFSFLFYFRFLYFVGRFHLGNFSLLFIFLDAADKFAPLRAKKSNTHIRKIETGLDAFMHIPTVKGGLKEGGPLKRTHICVISSFSLF